MSISIRKVLPLILISLFSLLLVLAPLSTSLSFTEIPFAHVSINTVSADSYGAGNPPETNTSESTTSSGLAWLLQEALELTIGSLVKVILWVPVFISGLYLLITASLFDFAVDQTVGGFSAWYADVFKNGVELAWIAFRDVGNIVMIALFVFVAISVILNITKYGLKQLGVRILIVALLINFSLFFTKVIIDISNLTALQFRQEITVAANVPSDQGISGAFMQRAGLADTFIGTAGESVSKIWSADVFTLNGNLWTYVILSVLFTTVAGSIFLFASILLLTRVIMFLLLMILSPLAFIAYMTPSMESWWGKWWSTLIKNALFAPLFMMLLWAVILITGGITGDSSIFDVTSSQNRNVAAFFNIGVVLGLLYASTVIANNLSLLGAKFAKDWGMKGFSGSLRASGVGLAMYGGLRLRNIAAERAEKIPGVRGTRFGARLNAMKDNNSIASTKFGKAAAKQGVSFGSVENDKAFAKYLAKVESDKQKGIVGESYDKEIGDLNAQAESVRDESKTRATQSEKQKDTLDKKVTEKESSIGAEIAKATKEKQGLEAQLRKKERDLETEDLILTPEERSEVQESIGAAQKAVAGQDEKIKSLNERLVRQQQRRERIDTAYKNRISTVEEKASSETGSIQRRIEATERQKAKALKKESNAIKNQAKEEIDRKWFVGKSVKEMAKAEIGKSEEDALLEKLQKKLKEDNNNSSSDKKDTNK